MLRIRCYTLPHTPQELFCPPARSASPRSSTTQPSPDGVVSTGGSNRAGQEVGEDFCWGSVAEDTPGSVVELAGDKVEVGLVVGDLGALGEVLAQQPVGVLVGAAFPRRVRVREVDVHSGREAERGVAGHLAALVPGEGLDQLRGDAGARGGGG